MARNTAEAWLKEEQGSDVIKRLNQTSVAETSFKSVPMSGTTKSEPRMVDMDVAVIAKGAAYGEDTGANDEVLLTARKFGRALRLAEEDIDDQVAPILESKKTGWVTSFGIALDNATLAVNGTENGGTVPFTSLYKALHTTNSATAYTANANVLTTAGALTYDDISDLASLVEVGGFHADSDALFIGHPTIKGLVRKLKDSKGDPLFVANPRAGDPDTLFGYPIKWSNGAVVTTAASSSQAVVAGGGAAGAAGNALLVFANTQYLLLGKRSGPESVVIDGRDGLSALTDETILKVRARRGFAVAHEKAAAILEITNA